MSRSPNVDTDSAGRLVASRRILTLAPGEVFVFGSNAAGHHGGGAARFAADRFGAIWGQGHGFQGHSYAIDSMSGLEALAADAAAFLTDAAQHPELTFLVTEIGCGIAGYRVDEIAPLFERAPDNVALPASFLATYPHPGLSWGTPLGRAVGCVVASAVGDALGAPYEFGGPLPDSVTPEFGPGPMGHEPAEWTDDTAMAVPILQAVAGGDSLLDADVLAGILHSWIEWSRDAKDVGAQTAAVLGRLGPRPTEPDAREAARDVHERTGHSAGNGSLMRTHPVTLAFLADGREADLAEAAGRIAQLTHAEEDNVDAVVLWTLMLRHAVRTGELVPTIGLPWLPPGHRSRWEELIEEALADGRHPRDFSQRNGWVVRAFQAALCAVAGAEDVPDALYRAVRGGNDADTVAAIAGSLAGALWGLESVPAPWRERVHGWPGYTTDTLTGLALRAARRSARPAL